VATTQPNAPLRICSIDICSPVIPRSVYPPALANILDHVIDLANRIRTDELPVVPQTPRTRGNWLRRTANIRSRPTRRLDRTNTSSSEAPVVPSPVVRTVPNRDIPRINQAHPTEAHYPAITRYSPRPSSAQTLPQNDHTAPVRLPVTEGLHCYYPEYSFLAENIPTRNYAELVQFFAHCQTLVRTQPIVHINHPLSRLRDITTDPLNFVNFLWRVQITITLQGITERYSYIRRRVRHGHPDKAILEPAFDVSFIWSSHHWTVTPVTPR
jgi:hypothetical protein